jgi:hypothetical protein
MVILRVINIRLLVMMIDLPAVPRATVAVARGTASKPIIFSLFSSILVGISIAFSSF